MPALLLVAASVLVAPTEPAGADGNEIPGAPPTARDLTAGGSHSCAVVARRALKCWGGGDSGQLGYGDAGDRGDEPDEMGNHLPTVFFGLGLQVQSVSAGQAHTCVRSLEGHVVCWGANGDGQLGLGDTDDRGDGPGEMGTDLPRVDLGQSGGPRFADAIATGDVHTCALLDTRRVKCWGANGQGQLGQGDTDDRGDGPGEMGTALVPVALGTGRTAEVIAGGGAHTCTLLDDGTVKCWGDNASGQLGQGDTDPRGDGTGEMGDSLPAVDLGASRTARALALGTEHTCALLDDGTVKCWGDNASGQLGQGDTDPRGDGTGEMGDSLPAVDLGAGRVAIGITAGGHSSCALLDDVILGTPAGDVVNGLGGNDVICGGGGPDRLNGGGGHDHVFGQAGADRLRGSTGNDTLDGADGDDVAFGGDGIDRLVGGLGTDRLNGGDQNDLFQAGPGPDRLYGGNHDDRMNGDTGNDLLDGGAGDDRLNGDAHRDTCHGRSGADTQSGCEVTTGIP